MTPLKAIRVKVGLLKKTLKVVMVLSLRHSSVDLSAHSIRRPRFESQANHRCFNQFVFELCRVEKTKINYTRQG